MSTKGAFLKATQVPPPIARTLDAQINLLKNKEPLKLNRAERRAKQKFENRSTK